MSPARQWLRRLPAGGWALLLTVVFSAAIRAQETHSAEAVKAAYLYRFAGYVEWPEESVAGHPFIIDVVGAPDVANALRHLLPGHLINNQVVQVREVTRVKELGEAQMLYVAADHDDFLHAMNASGASPLLVVTDEEQGLAAGGVLNFVTVDKRVRFEVSLTAAERAHLKISADLLSVAIRVHGGRRQSDEFCIPFALPEMSEAPCGIREARRLPRDPASDAGMSIT